MKAVPECDICSYNYALFGQRIQCLAPSRHERLGYTWPTPQQMEEEDTKPTGLENLTPPSIHPWAM